MKIRQKTKRDLIIRVSYRHTSRKYGIKTINPTATEIIAAINTAPAARSLIILAAG